MSKLSGIVKFFSDHVVYWLFDDACSDPFQHGYVGLTNNLDHRLKVHQRKNFSDFRVVVLFSGTRRQCAKEERRYRPQPEIGWNLMAGGFCGRDPGQEIRDRISAALLKVPHKLRTNLGKKFTPEHCAKLAAQRGWKHSEENKAKMRAKKIGRKLSAEHRMNMSIAHKARWQELRQ